MTLEEFKRKTWTARISISFFFKQKTWPAWISRQFCGFCRRTIDKVNIELQWRRRGRNYFQMGFLFGNREICRLICFQWDSVTFFAFCFLVLVAAEARQTSFPQVMIGKMMFPIFLIIKINKYQCLLAKSVQKKCVLISKLKRVTVDCFEMGLCRFFSFLLLIEHFSACQTFFVHLDEESDGGIIST